MESNQFLFLNEILESSSSDDEITNFIVSHIKEKRPKIKNFIDIINKYSDKEVSKFRKKNNNIDQYNEQERSCFKFFNK